MASAKLRRSSLDKRLENSLNACWRLADNQFATRFGALSMRPASTLSRFSCAAIAVALPAAAGASGGRASAATRLSSSTIAGSGGVTHGLRNRARLQHQLDVQLGDG